MSLIELFLGVQHFVFELKFKILIHQTSSWVRTNREFGEKENDSITPVGVG